MEYNQLVAVSGLPGLFELVSSKSDGGIVRSIEDQTTRFVSNRVHQFSHLESIEVYTIRENVNLVDVFKAMEKSILALPAEKDAKAVLSYFKSVFPDMDFERVYDSDRKKMIKWFAQLKKAAIELKLSEQE
jgi:CBS domain-containing protein